MKTSTVIATSHAILMAVFAALFAYACYLPVTALLNDSLTFSQDLAYFSFASVEACTVAFCVWSAAHGFDNELRQTILVKKA
jgi:hypothetical protein